MSDITLFQAAAAMTGNKAVITANGPLQLEFLKAKIVTSATVGNRQFTLRLKDSKGNELFSSPAGAVQAAAATVRYVWREMQATRETTVVGGVLFAPLAEVVIPDGGTIEIADDNAVSAADTCELAYTIDPDDFS